MTRFIAAVIRFQEAQAIPSRRQIGLACASIVALWGILLHVTWAHWGDLTVDCGREAYVPWVLSQGKRLYRDVWFPYGPVAPYFNALLYSLFGAKLSVLYWAGALSALVSALMLLLLGMRFSAITGGWTAGVILVVEAMAPGTIFSFPQPYSFSAVYACVATCSFLLAAAEAARSGRWLWMFASGCAASLALALKLEIGLALYAALAVLIVLPAVRDKSLPRLALDLGACLPGLAACALLMAWIMPPGGMVFLIQQNWMSTPGTYFMKTYGATWIAVTGGNLDAFHLVRAGLLCAATTGSWLAFWWVLTRTMKASSPFVARRVLPLALLVAVMSLALVDRALAGSWVEWFIAEIFKLLFLTPVIFFFVLVAAALVAWACWRSGFDRQLLGVAALLTASGMVGLRLIHYMILPGYSAYVNGPAILSLFLLLRWLSVPFAGTERKQILPIDFLLSVGMLGAVVLLLADPYQGGLQNSELVRSSRGDLYMPSAKAPRYAAVLQFTKEKAAIGESVLSVPEDAGLYFLAGVECPTRVYVFTPGVLTPGRITDQTIAEIESKHVDYLIWSTAVFRSTAFPNLARISIRRWAVISGRITGKSVRSRRKTARTGTRWSGSASVKRIN